MSDKVGPGNPPMASRFKKGKSGNPKGRPKKQKAKPPSAFDIIMDRQLTVTENGQQGEISVEEALQRKTYQEAVKGSRLARKEVLKWIFERERWMATKRPPPSPAEVILEPTDPTNAFAAMLLLDIAELDPRAEGFDDADEHLLLKPWSVQAALSRPSCRSLSRDDRETISRFTRAPETLRWPTEVGE